MTCHVLVLVVKHYDLIYVLCGEEDICHMLQSQSPLSPTKDKALATLQFLFSLSCSGTHHTA